ncbi:AI-2E family transporter [Actinomadura sp. NPDC047616]|uniref:AI-2E family transporter n=1 Tax=Actinomadura sp. NPDC047616 TaxID=3155914 RepID=UPI0033F4CC99
MPDQTPHDDRPAPPADPGDPSAQPPLPSPRPTAPGSTPSGAGPGAATNGPARAADATSTKTDAPTQTASNASNGGTATKTTSGGGADSPAETAAPGPAGNAQAGPAGDAGGDVALPDPVTDVDVRKQEAGVDETAPFGRPGRPLGQAHPFVFGFTGALGVLTAWLLVQAVMNVRQVLVLITVSMFLAVGLNPAVESLQRGRMPRGAAVGLVFLGVVLVFVGVGFAIVPPVTNEVSKFIDHLPTYISQLQGNRQIQEWDRRYQLLEKVQEAVTNPSFGQGAAGGLVGAGRVVVSGAFSTLTVLILTLYFLGSLPTITSFFYRLAPRSRRARVALLGDEILGRIGGYVAGTVMVALIAGTAAYIFLSIVGVPFALPLAITVAFTALIPLVGATIGAVLVSVVAFFDGLGTGIACVVFFVIYQQVENYLIHPRIMKRAVDVPPAVTIIAALIGGALLGFVGALLAIPTAAAVALIIREVILPRQESL